MSSVFATSLGGMRNAQAALDMSTGRIARFGLRGADGQALQSSATPAPTGSLETELVGQLSAKNAFLANLSVFRTNNEMMGSLLDIQG